MMNRIAIRLSLAALLATAPVVALASDAAATKLFECMKMKAATPEQKKCLEAVTALRRAAPKAAATTARPKPMDPKAQAAAAAKAPPVPAEVKQAATVLAANGSSISGVGAPLRPLDVSGMDLETAMLQIQSRRAELLESQLTQQIAELQARNDNLAKFNMLAADLQKLRPSGTDPLKWGNLGANPAEGKAMYKRLEDAGLAIPKTGDDRVDEPGTGIYDARQKTFDAWNQELKVRMELANSTQQMDMLRLQSLMNKRNEAFDIMTNFIKKMADSRSSILGNMR